MKKVLILDNVYMPLNIVSMKKAYKMIVKSSIYERMGLNSEYHVDVLEYFEEELITCKGELSFKPAVLRIAHYKKPAKKNIKIYAPLTRTNLWKRDEGMCQYCFKKVKLQDMHWDHVIPRKLFGKTSWDNLVCACLSCNNKKADKTLEEAKLHLKKMPEPVYNEVTESVAARERVIRKMSSCPKEWEIYLACMGIK